MSEERGTYRVDRKWDQPLIRNCQFAFRCTQRWNSLEPTSDPSVRRCHECERPVVLCKTDDELREALLANECVAVPTHDGSALTHTVGVLSPC